MAPPLLTLSVLIKWTDAPSGLSVRFRGESAGLGGLTRPRRGLLGAGTEPLRAASRQKAALTPASEDNGPLYMFDPH